MLDENRWIAARHGLDGEMVDLPGLRARADQGARQAALRPARGTRGGPRLGERLEGIEDLLERGNGAHRQQVVYEANHDLHEVVREIAEASVPEQSSA